MPEGPEVKLSADLIRPLVQGKRIINAFPAKNSRYAGENPEGFSKFLDTLSKEVVRVTDVNVKGKFMYWTFDNGWYMFSTFGMTGQWSPKEGKHPCFGFYLGEDPFSSFETMFFNDPRHFGTIKFINSKQELYDKLNELGWDPLQFKLEDFSLFLNGKIQNSNKLISQLLMDQSIFAGVGNYIKSEALYASALSPWRSGNSLTTDDINNLCKNIVNVMETSYKYQGATIQTYKTAYGAEGKYSSCFKVYGQKTDPLGNKIIKEETPDKRTTHWCPAIQK